MRLFEAIIDANHRALAGDREAGLHPDDFENELPIAALTCIDVRLNALLPSVLGIPNDRFVWVRNAGNLVDGPTGAMTRALAVACALKGAKEIAIIGHTDCHFSGTGASDLTQRLRALQIDTSLLPSNLSEFFGLFPDARANVIKGVDIARHSPLIGSKIPIHGLMLDTATGRVEWVVDGYNAASSFTLPAGPMANLTPGAIGSIQSIPGFQIGEIKFPTAKIGEIGSGISDWHSLTDPAVPPQAEAPPVAPPAQRPLQLKKPPPGVIPMPRPFAARPTFPRKSK
jgi:carbonic anhydrase